MIMIDITASTTGERAWDVSIDGEHICGTPLRQTTTDLAIEEARRYLRGRKLGISISMTAIVNVPGREQFEVKV